MQKTGIARTERKCLCEIRHLRGDNNWKHIKVGGQGRKGYKVRRMGALSNRVEKRIKTISHNTICWPTYLLGKYFRTKRYY